MYMVAIPLLVVSLAPCTFVYLQLQWLEEELMPYLKEWEESVSNRKGFNNKDQLMMLLAKETRVGITVTGR